MLKLSELILISLASSYSQRWAVTGQQSEPHPVSKAGQGGPVICVLIGQGVRILIADWSVRALTTRCSQARSLGAWPLSVAMHFNQAAQLPLLLLANQRESSAVIGQCEPKILIPLSRLNECNVPETDLFSRPLEGSRNSF